MWPLTLFILTGCASAQVACNVAPPSPAPPSFLGTAAQCAVIAYAGVSNAGSSSIEGNVAVHPYDFTSVTGLNPPVPSGPGTIFGALYTNDAGHNPGAALQAMSDATTAYNHLASQIPTSYISILDGAVLTPGVYAAPTSMFLAQSSPGLLTLDALGNPNAVWIFQAGTTLTTAAGGIATIQFKNGGSPANVFWQVGSSATVNGPGGSTFMGSIMAKVSVTIGSGTVLGSVAALTGAVSISTASTIEAQSSISTATFAPTSNAPIGSACLTSFDLFFVIDRSASMGWPREAADCQWVIGQDPTILPGSTGRNCFQLWLHTIYAVIRDFQIINPGLNWGTGLRVAVYAFWCSREETVPEMAMYVPLTSSRATFDAQMKAIYNVIPVDGTCPGKVSCALAHFKPKLETNIYYEKTRAFNMCSLRFNKPTLAHIHLPQ